MHRAWPNSIAGRSIASTMLLFVAAVLSAQTPDTQNPTPAPQAPQSSSQPNQMPPTPTELPSPAQPAEWETYSFPADGFSASFPTEPTQQKQSVNTAAGTFELRTYLAASDAVALYVGVCDYGEAAKGGDPDAILQGAQSGAVSNVNAHLVNSKKVMLGIYPGVAFEAGSGGAHLFGRIYLVGSLLYQAFVALPSNRPYPDTTKFLDSFQLIPRTTP
ncbi:MAG: hypothetical protein ACLPZY_05295 [Terracidiphilus sp.]